MRTYTAMQNTGIANLREAAPAVSHLSLIQAITERSRSRWFHVRRKRYAKRLFLMRDADVARQKEMTLFDALLREHREAMEQQVWYSDMEGDMVACDHCGEKIYGRLCQSNVGEVFHWGCACVVLEARGAQTTPEYRHGVRPRATPQTNAHAKRCAHLDFQNTRGVRAMSEQSPLRQARHDVRLWNAEDEEITVTSSRSRMSLRNYEPRAAQQEMERAGVVRSSPRVSFNRRGAWLRGRKPAQASCASGRRTKLQMLRGEATICTPCALRDAEMEGELLSRSPEVSSTLKEPLTRPGELGVAYVWFVRLTHVCFYLCVAQFLRSLMPPQVACLCAYAWTWAIAQNDAASHGANCRTWTALACVVCDWLLHRNLCMSLFLGVVLWIAAPRWVLWWPYTKFALRPPNCWSEQPSSFTSASSCSDGRTVNRGRCRDTVYDIDTADVVSGALTLESTGGWAPTAGMLSEIDMAPNPALNTCLHTEWTSAKTRGDGACSVHALLGVPAHGELACANARDIISETFRQGYNIPSVRKKIDVILENSWKELAAALVRNEHERNETGIWWQTLSDDVRAACAEHAHNSEVEKQSLAGQRRQAFKDACRMFFSASAEEAVVRRLAVAVGFIPSGVDVLRRDADGVDRHGWLAPAYEVVHGSLRVCGNHEVSFPSGGPDCKYSALFDPRSCFDDLRTSFVEEAGVCVVINFIDSMLTADQASADMVGHMFVFHEALVRFQETMTAHGDWPRSFARVAWPTYLEVLNTSHYFLSVQELLLVAEIKQINVLIVSWDPGTLDFHSQGHVHAGVDPYVLILLKGNMQKRGTVRSHYERLFRREDKIAGAEALHSRTSEMREQSQMESEDEYGRTLRARALWTADEPEVPPPPPPPPQPVGTNGNPFTRKRPRHKNAALDNTKLHSSPSESKAPRTQKKQVASDTKGSEKHNAVAEQDAKGDVTDEKDKRGHYYDVRCMCAVESPDSRCQLESSLLELASVLRDDPTVPADPEEPNAPLSAALLEDAAVFYPRSTVLSEGVCSRAMATTCYYGTSRKPIARVCRLSRSRCRRQEAQKRTSGLCTTKQ